MVGFGWFGSAPSDMAKQIGFGSGFAAAYLVPVFVVVVFLLEIKWEKKAGDPLGNNAGEYVYWRVETPIIRIASQLVNNKHDGTCALDRVRKMRLEE